MKYAFPLMTLYHFHQRCLIISYSRVQASSDHNKIVKITNIFARSRVTFMNTNVLIGESVDMSVMPGLICVYCLRESCFLGSDPRPWFRSAPFAEALKLV